MKPETPDHPPREPAAELNSMLRGEPLPRLLFEGLPGMAFLARNDRARTIELAGAGSEALLGPHPKHKPFALAPLVHADDREQVLEVVRAAVAEKRSFAVEYRLRHFSGEWRTVWEQGRPTGSGISATVQGQLLDVTHRLGRERARLATELRLLQGQKFRTLNELAAGVAHEFNNLVAGILGSAELMALDLPDSHPGHETLKQIFEASIQARDFVHKLRVLGQRPPPEFKPIRLQPVIEECLQILRTIIPAKVILETEIDAGCPRVEADSAQLHQAVLDLCLYVWQGLADRRGRIKISLETCPVVRLPAGTPNLLQPGPHVRLTVQDNSSGLDKAVRDHIFHPFRHRRQGGTKVGLELFLVRETIHGHLGEIFLETEPGSGLAFRIYLPLAANGK
ncbi:MAG: ATP-binding protein [Verrucomicrobiota bacterium]